MLELLQAFQNVIEAFILPLLIAVGGLLLLISSLYLIVTFFQIKKRKELKEIRLTWRQGLGSSPERFQPVAQYGQGFPPEYRDALVRELVKAELSPGRRLEKYRQSGNYEKDVTEFTSKTWWVRVQALDRLKYFAPADFPEKLVSLIYDSSHDVRLVALDLLSRLEEIPEIDPLELFNSFSEELDSFLIIKLLAVKPDKQFILPLADGQKVRFRRAGAILMGQSKKLAFLPLLQKLTKDDAVSVRKSAAESLGKIGLERVLPALDRASEDKEAPVREATAKSLKEIPEKDSLRILTGLAEDSDFRVRLAAFQSLTYFGEEGRNVIGDYWSSDNELAREAMFESYQR